MFDFELYCLLVIPRGGPQAQCAVRQALVHQLEQPCAAFDAALANDADPTSDACQQTLRSIRLTLDRMNYLRTVLRNLR